MGRLILRVAAAVVATLAVVAGAAALAWVDWKYAARSAGAVEATWSEWRPTLPRNPAQRPRLYLAARVPLLKGTKLADTGLGYRVGRVNDAISPVARSRQVVGQFATGDILESAPLETRMFAPTAALSGGADLVVLPVHVDPTIATGLRPGMWLGILDSKGRLQVAKRLPKRVQLLAIVPPAKEDGNATLFVATALADKALLTLLQGTTWRPVVLGN